jgi:hypothetical protein
VYEFCTRNGDTTTLGDEPPRIEELKGFTLTITQQIKIISDSIKPMIKFLVEKHFHSLSHKKNLERCGMSECLSVCLNVCEIEEKIKVPGHCRIQLEEPHSPTV